jgi:hypothetical protein
MEANIVMKDVLLLGNGMNRISQDYSWENLIISLIDRFCDGNVNHDKDYSKPFPLLYEEILSYALLHEKGDESTIKNFIKDEIGKISLNDSHLLIPESNFNEILTTNYDETIEKAIGGDIKFNNNAQVEEQKYSLLRKKVAEGVDKSVWHIHGEVAKPNTITLGYEQYAGYLQNIRASVTVGNKYTNFELPNLWDRIELGNTDTWIDYLFNRNVHIVGLSLDFSEIDLWWLLVYRSRQKHNYNIEKNNYRISNQIFYYYAQSPRINKTDIGKLEILNSLDVTLVPIELKGKRWIDYYRKVFERISFNRVI